MLTLAKIGAAIVGVATVIGLLVAALQYFQSLGASNSQDVAQARLVGVLEEQLKVQREMATLQASNLSTGPTATEVARHAVELESTVVALSTLQSKLEANLASAISIEASPTLSLPTSDTPTIAFSPVPPNTPTAVPRPSRTPALVPSAVSLGQDGLDYTVAGCPGGDLPQGHKGVSDNHIRVSGIKNIDSLKRIDIRARDSDYWEYPCSYPKWEIVVHKTSEGVLDLYFEPVTDSSFIVTFTIILIYNDGTELQFTATGPSGLSGY